MRCDTAIYDLKPEPTNKKGRPTKRGKRLRVNDFEYTKEVKYFFGLLVIIW